MDLSNVSDIVQFLIVILPVVGGGILWCTKTYHKIDTMSKFVQKMMAEFQPNGGSSLKDAINRVEQKIAEIELTQKVYIDSDSTIPMFQTSNLGLYTWANKAFLQLVGRPIEEIVGTGWTLTIVQEDREQVRKEWNQAIVDGRSFEYCYTILDKDNKKHYVKCRAFGNSKSGYVGLLHIDFPHEVSNGC